MTERQERTRYAQGEAGFHGLPRYAGVATFMRTPLAHDPSGLDIALIGVPFDGGVENRPGQRHGPRQIREMSSLIRSVHHVTRINPYRLCRVADLGDVPIDNPFDVAASHDAIAEFYRKVHAAGAVPLSAGGDHSISLPILRAIAADCPVGMVHIDAHTDTCDEELGAKSPMARPSDELWKRGCSTLSARCRSASVAPKTQRKGGTSLWSPACELFS